MTHYYSSTAVDTTLSIGIGAADTSITVASTTGFPTSYPYTLAIGYDTSTEELVDVTYASGNVLTITRQVDSTPAQSHAAASSVKHVICGRDLRDSQTHIDSTTSVHGIADTSVLTTASNTQTFTNKSIAFGTNASAITANGATLSATELSYLDGVTSAIQTQINAKAPLASPTFTGTVTLPGGTALYNPVLGGTMDATGAYITAPYITGATLSSPGISSGTLDSASTIGGVSGTQLAAMQTAWSTYTPTLGGTGWTWTGTAAGRYKQIGKTVFFSITYSSSAVLTAGSSALTFTLPVTPLSSGTGGEARGTFNSNAGYSYILQAAISPGSTTMYLYTPTTGSANQGLALLQLKSGLTFLASGSADSRTIQLSGTYEVA